MLITGAATIFVVLQMVNHLFGLAAALVTAGRHNGNKRQKIHTRDEEEAPVCRKSQLK